MFNGKFLERQTQVAVLEKIEGAVSEASLAALLQWIYTKRINLTVTDSNPISESASFISAALEFARFADMCGVTGMESEMAHAVERSIKNYRVDHAIGVRDKKPITDEHMTSSEHLPPGHPMRRALAKVFVAGFICSESSTAAHRMKFFPNLAADVLQEMVEALHVRHHKYHDINRPRKRFKISFIDPSTEKEIVL